jgi:hypothetical protein
MLLLNCNKGGNEMKKKVNYYKIGALVLMLVEIGIAIFTDKELINNSMKVWRLYTLCVMFIPVNFMFICTKQTRKAK